MMTDVHQLPRSGGEDVFQHREWGGLVYLVLLG